MEAKATPTTGKAAPGLLVSRSAILAARTRGTTPSDGGGTGRSDGND